MLLQVQNDRIKNTIMILLVMVCENEIDFYYSQ
jgi:hypothetical protein